MQVFETSLTPKSRPEARFRAWDGFLTVWGRVRLSQADPFPDGRRSCRRPPLNGVRIELAMRPALGG
ncbi:hypothetical protein MJA45_05605 [Paenibacillus aurantius]|uniref:Uncharacterized protein n=1 Tax=Paenibacillus aurantius TaxID=2918900 RepID=A0AA96RGN1_9BACL|nr:hypothetical protein [Paenibacillus aurantius]WNQ12508.1 hypothetical protein MJA45_05605 [Paenibacillus aurantius]